jgi:RNA polymerase sigma factor (sigma-70 family)
MPFRGLDRVLHNIRRAAIVSGAVPRTDGQLLSAFVHDHDEASFDALMRRYGTMVFGVCRRVLRNVHDAEDAFQATLLVLVRKAAKLQRREAVGNWLYGVAYRTALQAKSRATRRRCKEAEAQPMMPEVSTAETAAQLELQDRLDRELNRLPEKYRTPIIFCELMGKTKKQAAAELRCPEGTVSSRLARGREILRRRLGGHSESLAGGAGQMLSGQQLSQALPIGLYSKTLKAALLVAQGKLTVAAGLTPNVAGLLRGVMRAMLISKLITGLLAVAVTGGLIGGAATLIAGRGDLGRLTVVAEGDANAKALVPVQEKKVEKPAEDAVQKERLRYGGKDFNEWKDILFTDLKPEVRIEALTAVAAFGANGYGAEATEAVIATMKKYDVAQYPLFGGAISPTNVLFVGNRQLAVIGRAALPVLSKEFETKDITSRRVVAVSLDSMLLAFPTETLPLFFQAVVDDDRFVRNAALAAMIQMNRLPAAFTGSERQRIVTTLIKQLKDEDIQVRQNAAAVLAWFGPDANAAVPVLIELLDDKNPLIPKAMKKGQAGMVAAAPKGGKGGGFGDDFGGFGGQVGKGKGKAAPKAPNSGGFGGGFGGVGGPLPANDDSLRLQVVRTLGSIGPEAKDALPSLLAAFQFYNQDLLLRAQVIRTLGDIGPAAKDTVPILISFCVPDKKGSVERHYYDATTALGKIGPDAKSAVPVLISHLGDGTGYQQFLLQAIIALGDIGPDAKEAVPRLLQIQNATALSGYSGPQLAKVQDEAAKALKKIQK